MKRTEGCRTALFAGALPVGRGPCQGRRPEGAERSDPLTGWPEGIKSPAKSGSVVRMPPYLSL